MKNLYRKHLQIKYNKDLTLETLTELKNLHQNEFMDELTSDMAEKIEQEELGRVLSFDERKVERSVLASPILVRCFVDVETEKLDQSRKVENRFFRLSDDDQKTCLKYVSELRKDGRRAGMFAQKFYKMGMTIDQIPQKYIDMTEQELQSEIVGWRITFDAR